MPGHLTDRERTFADVVTSWRPARTRGDWDLRDTSGAVVGRVRQVPRRGGPIRWQATTASGYRLDEELEDLAQAKLAVEVMVAWPTPIGDQRRPRPGRRRYVDNAAPDPAPHPGTPHRPTAG